ncbi:MAG: bifunctional folylpolyglutamate synthase/dihydrofolate synthase [bacterium]
MKYQEAVQWMFKQLPMYQRQGASAYKKDLSNTILLANYLGNPEKKLNTIHVGGTNGKGSSSHMLASILQEAGYKVGLYTSPHLKDFRERIKINGKPISKNFVIGFIKKHRIFFEANNLSFFEMTVGMAFDAFVKKKVDVAIIEVGLGGRLDSTNIIKPIVSIITNIGYDHQHILGNTLPEIANEKAGIIKHKTSVIIGERHTETEKVFIDKAEAEKAPISFAEEFSFKEYETDLKGSYQSKNKQTVLAALSIIKKHFKVNDTAIRRGLKNVIANTGLMGRWQILSEEPLIICDTAHNKEGLTLVMRQLLALPYKELHMVLGFVDDKKLSELISLFPKKAIYYFCTPDVPRGKPVNETKEIFASHKILGKTFSSVSKAFRAAKLNSNSSDIIFVGGSTFVVAEVV